MEPDKLDDGADREREPESAKGPGVQALGFQNFIGILLGDSKKIRNRFCSAHTGSAATALNVIEHLLNGIRTL